MSHPNHKYLRLMLLAGSVLAAASAPAFGQAVNAGDLLIYRVGANSGTDTEASTGNAVYIDEWTTSGAYVRSYSTGIFASGTATSEGMLNLSPNDQYLAFTGYASTYEQYQPNQ